jgi:hypothetical protein
LKPCLIDCGDDTAASGEYQPSSKGSPNCKRTFAAMLNAGATLSHITSMALAKKATTIALDPEDDRLLSVAARERGVSRSEFVRQHLALVFEQYRRHPRLRSAGTLRTVAERGDERELRRDPS